MKEKEYGFYNSKKKRRYKYLLCMIGCSVTEQDKGCAKAYLGPCQASKMERSMKIFNGFKQLTIFAKKLYHRCLRGW